MAVVVARAVVDSHSGEAMNTASMSGGGGGADAAAGGQGRLVRNMMAAKQEMESAGAEREKPSEGPEVAEGGGIILGKKNKAGGGGKLPSKGEIASLRNSIQTLCQSSNPLGRCLEYVQEDLDAMSNELEEWRKKRNRRASELAEEEESTKSTLEGLKTELERVDELIREKQAQVRFVKASILHNDQKIETQLAKVVHRPA